MRNDPSKPWFAPKRYGYGAGLPIAWQGWALIAGYFLIFIGAINFSEQDKPGSTFMSVVGMAILGVATVAFVLICAAKTKGGWRWRWGGKP
ncbi:hypothetical protein AEAC466_12655 [Asticcacaulis sp. AC466]|uniref:hypothetical protein n=1 Tax=Asticcacaulis sp. AC466 TaxID=1282362 RepID=UPI0003C3B792|nr:hypothetical protein [Asticcacaulis sp. AC466]ESQ83520.1 hypothetical protein AEAC466_12655 [Asticcacaulis sp. AC466]